MSQSAPGDAREAVLLQATHQGVATLTLNRPRQFNALSDALLTALADALRRIANDPAVRAVVIAANGKAFCAGHDLKEMRARTDLATYRALFGRCSDLMRQIQALPQPVIARVHGMATAAGCQLVATCDLAVAAEEASFATNGIDHGLFCATPAVALSRNVPRKNAFEMLFTGTFYDAHQARTAGLVNQVVAAHELDAAVTALADRIKARPAEALAASKQFFYAQLEQDQAAAYASAAEKIACDLTGPVASEGVDAFLAKRPPAWRHDAD